MFFRKFHQIPITIVFAKFRDIISFCAKHGIGNLGSRFSRQVPPMSSIIHHIWQHFDNFETSLFFSDVQQFNSSFIFHSQWNTSTCSDPKIYLFPQNDRLQNLVKIVRDIFVSICVHIDTRFAGIFYIW